MKYKVAIILLLSLCLLPVHSYAEGWRLTIDEALKRAKEENRDIQSARERLNELKGLRQEALSQGLPQLTGTSSYQHTWRKPQMNINGMIFEIGSHNTYTAGAGVTQLLWDGGRVIKAVGGAKAELQSGTESVRNIEEQIRLQVKQLFYQILYTDRLIEVLERQLKQLKGHLSSIHMRFNEGIDSDYTLMRQEVEVSNVEPEIIEAKRIKDFLLNSMKILLAIPPADEFYPNGELKYDYKPIPEITDMVTKAKNTRPDYASARYHENALKALIGMEKAGYWPTLNLAGAFQWQGQTDDWKVGNDERTDSLYGLITLSWPIFDGLKTFARVKQAKAKFLQQKYANSAMGDSVDRDVRDAFDTLVKARQTLETQRKSFNTAKRASAIASERFEAGLMSQLELNDTITAQAKAEELYYKAVYDCINAEALLEKAVGGEQLFGGETK